MQQTAHQVHSITQLLQVQHTEPRLLECALRLTAQRWPVPLITLSGMGSDQGRSESGS